MFRMSALTLLVLMLAGCDLPAVSGSSATDAGQSGEVTGGPASGQETGETGSSQPVCEPTEAEQAMLDAVNAARAQARVCGNDAFTATQSLTFNCALRDAARAHSRDMRDHNFFSHTGSDGLRVSDRVSAQGYDWRSVGENIAAGYPDLQSVMRGWLDSPGHCANIMSPAYTEMGSAFEPGNDFSDYGTYWTQVFAAPGQSGR